MKINKYLVGIIGLFLMFSIQAQAATVQIRLVEAYNSTGKAAGIPVQLQDVASLLKKNLPYNSFSLLGNSSVNIPSSGPVSMGGYRLILSGSGKNLAVKVIRNNKPVLQSRVKLEPKSPVILGGFPGNKGKVMFILNLR